MRNRLKFVAVLVVAGAAVVMVYGVGSASGASSARFGPWGRGAPASPPDAAASEAAASPGATEDGTMTIEIITHPIKDVFIDEAPTNAYSPGDRDLFTEELHDATTGQLIGIDHVTCTKQVGGFAECAGTGELYNRGKIVFGGSSTFAQRFFHLPITGGSGEFAAAGGVVVVDTFTGPDTPITIKLLSMS